MWDASVRDGSWRPYGRPKFPLVLGTHGAGTVVLKGNRVRRFRIADRVWAYHYANPKGGFYAEYVAGGCAARRASAEAQAGAAATTGLTALQGIDDALHLRKGETVLIYGASGAVGTLGLQFAKRRRARIVASATGRDATALVRRLGAKAVFDAQSRDAVDHLRKIAPGGLDAALVLASGDSLEGCIDLVNPRGLSIQS